MPDPFPIPGTPGALLGNLQGPYMQHAPAMMHQVPTLDYQSALKGVRPRGGTGRSQDAGTHAGALGALGASQAQNAAQRTMIPMSLYGQQAGEILDWGNLFNQEQGLRIQGANQFVGPLLGGISGGIGNVLGGLGNLGNIQIGG